MEFRRFLNSVVLVPAMVIRRARSITVRIIGYNPGLDRLFSTWSTIERIRNGDRPCPKSRAHAVPRAPGRRRAAP